MKQHILIILPLQASIVTAAQSGEVKNLKALH